MRVWELSALWWWNSIGSDPRCRCLLKAQPWLIAVWVAACCLQVSRFHMSERRDPAALCSNFAGIMVPKQRQPRGFSQSPGWTCFLAALDFFGFSDWNPRDRLDPPVLSCLSVNHKVWEHPLWGCLAWHIIYNFFGGAPFFPKCPLCSWSHCHSLKTKSIGWFSLFLNDYFWNTWIYKRVTRAVLVWWNLLEPNSG